MTELPLEVGGLSPDTPCAKKWDAYLYHLLGEDWPIVEAYLDMRKSKPDSATWHVAIQLLLEDDPLGVEANEDTLGRLALRFLKALPTGLERLGWLLIFVGFPMGNTTVGLAVVFLGALGRLVTRQPFAWAIPPTDRFYLWAWIFLGITVLSALWSHDILVGLSLSLGFFLMFFLITRGSSDLLCPKPYFPAKLVAYIVLISGLFSSIYAMYTYFGLGRSRAIGLATSVNGLGTVSAFLAILALGYALHSWKHSKFQSGLSLITSVAAAGSLVFSFSRGAWLGFAFSLLLFIVL